MNSNNSFYDACANDNNIDEDGLLECIAKKMYTAHDDASRNAGVFFLVYASSLVFFMQAGFAMICAGSVRQKNLQNTLLKNLLDACGSAIAYFSVGYGFSSGGDSTGKTFIGDSHFFLSGLQDSENDEYSLYLFQFAFAATSATIVAGTMVERCQMRSYLLYSMFLTGFVYPVVSHWVWSDNGFLSYSVDDPLWGIGVIDCAGSIVVHITGGMTALVATMILGPRKGRFTHEITGERLREPNPMHGHSTSLQMLGTFILWFGWFGFNAGSVMNAGDSRIMSVALINTTLSAATAGITALFTDLILNERITGESIYNIKYGMNGCISGLVAITGGCGVIEPWAAIVVGLVAGWLYLFSSKLLVRLRIDDAVDSIPIHLSNGIWGAISTALFASSNGMQRLFNGTVPPHIGLFYSFGQGSSDATLLACHAIGILVIMAWVTSLMGTFFFFLNYFGLLRCDAMEEVAGLDFSYSSNPTSRLLSVSEHHAKKRKSFINKYGCISINTGSTDSVQDHHNSISENSDENVEDDFDI